MKQLFTRYRDCESGVTSVEYALLAGILGVGLVVGVAILGNDVTGQYDDIGSTVHGSTEQNINNIR